MLNVPMHPGEVLSELYLVPSDLTSIALAHKLGVPRTRIERLVSGATSMSTDTALRLAKAFGTTPEYWVNMQTNFDMAQARGHVDVTQIEPLYAHA